MSLFARQPWFDPAFVLPGLPVGMLGASEGALFYHLAREWWRGRGTIVDAGSFLGRSAYCFARGLQANPGFVAARDRIHCFDNFLVNETTTVDFLRANLGVERRPNDSTRDLFDQQVRDVQELLTVHAGDFHSATWSHQPVEVLMVDIAKSKRLGGRVVELFFPCLVPGASIVVQQDYHHAWLPHIHVVMESLADSFECVAPAVDDSAAFLLVEPLSATALRRAVAFDFPVAEQLDLMDRVVRRSGPTRHWHVELARLVLRAEHLPIEAVRQELDALGAAAQGGVGRARLAADLVAFRAYLDHAEGWRSLAAGEPGRALQLAQQLVERGQLVASGVHLQCAALERLGRPHDAARVAREAIERNPLCSDAYLVLARSLAAVGSFAAAEQAVLVGLRVIGPDRTEPRWYFELLGSVWERRGDVDAVGRQLPALRAEFGELAEFWVLDAQFRASQGLRADCVQSLRRSFAAGIDPVRGAEVLRGLGVLPSEVVD